MTTTPDLAATATVYVEERGDGYASPYATADPATAMTIASTLAERMARRLGGNAYSTPFDQLNDLGPARPPGIGFRVYFGSDFFADITVRAS